MAGKAPRRKAPHSKAARRRGAAKLPYRSDLGIGDKSAPQPRDTKEVVLGTYAHFMLG
jgi:hypothetical protein